MSAPKDSSDRVRRLKAQTLAAYKSNNSALPDMGNNGSMAETLLLRNVGILTTPCGCKGCPSNSDISGFTYVDQYDVSGIYNYKFTISWNPLPFTYTFTLGALNAGAQKFEVTSSNSGILYTETYTNGPDGLVYVIIHRFGCPDIQTGLDGPCFLAGALVTLGDGTNKPIEEVVVGDSVLGAFGEINIVLALHRPLLGNFTLTSINDEHKTTSHHPHISIDKKFYAAAPSGLAHTYGKEHDVIDGSGNIVKQMLYGLAPGRVTQLEIGVDLKTVEGSRKVRSINSYMQPPDTQLYNLVVSGSHTYHVDGYAVTGWPREDDFDYDAWVSK